ncbi:MAG: J domain-containing protein [Acidobacteria bacterium]|nr:J domain-containing protein [Acidobacteriota bacterium]
MVNYYDILKTSPKASNAEIKSAYRRLARKLHPDKNNGSEETARAFAAIAEAYEILGNPKERSRYDRQLLQSEYETPSNGDSVFTSSNTHARRWRQMVYEHRYNEIINRMVAEERREAMELQKLIFPVVALFVSIFVAAMAKPAVFERSAVIGKIILVSLFIAGTIHIYGRIRDGLRRFTYNEDDLHDSIFDDPEPVAKPYSRLAVGGIIAVGSVASLAIGLLVGDQVNLSSHIPTMFAPTLQLEFLLYPPIFVLVVDLIHSLVLRVDV